MRKSKKNLDLNISREVTRRFRTVITRHLDTYVSECRASGCKKDEYFDALYLRDTMFSKYIDEDTDSPESRRHAAIVKWLGVEQLNRKTNDRLFSTDPYFYGLGSAWDVLLSAAKRIRRVLGSSPEPELLFGASFSGGASTSLKRGVGVLASKFTGVRDVTPLAHEVALQHLKEFETWSFYSPEVVKPRVVKGNILFTVPKTAVIDRVACKEPDYNVFFQKAVGDSIRRRLLKGAKINLNDQSINRALAREGSITGKLATIDLSSASDSVSIALVSILLPYDWFLLLDSLRCHKTFIDGASHTNEMFSSMGNGFTFELESLIFWAIACEVRARTRSPGRVSVYGDDIIIPSACAGALIKFLSWCGFRTNVTKTFTRGPFRESCGGHYYRGRDVTPFFLRKPFTHVSDLILTLNQYRRWLIQTEMDTVDGGYAHLNAFTRLWYDLAAFVPKCLWGGFDLNSRTQLVHPSTKHSELFRRQRRHAELELELQMGLYLSRLSELDRRSWPRRDMDVVESGLTSDSTWVLRRSSFEPAIFGLAKPSFVVEQEWSS